MALTLKKIVGRKQAKNLRKLHSVDIVDLAALKGLEIKDFPLLAEELLHKLHSLGLAKSTADGYVPKTSVYGLIDAAAEVTEFATEPLATTTLVARFIEAH